MLFSENRNCEQAELVSCGTVLGFRVTRLAAMTGLKTKIGMNVGVRAANKVEQK